MAIRQVLTCDGWRFGTECRCEIKARGEEGEWPGVVTLAAALPQGHADALPQAAFELPELVAWLLAEVPEQRVHFCICCAREILGAGPPVEVPAAEEREASEVTGGN